MAIVKRTLGVTATRLTVANRICPHTAISHEHSQSLSVAERVGLHWLVVAFRYVPIAERSAERLSLSICARFD